MLFLFLAFCCWWRLIFLSHRWSSGSASSTSLTLTAACRWSCFFLVRSAQFCELYYPFSYMPHVSCFMPHASHGGGIHTCMIILPLMLLPSPIGVFAHISLLSYAGMAIHVPCSSTLLHSAAVGGPSSSCREEAMVMPHQRLRHCQRPAGGPASFW